MKGGMEKRERGRRRGRGLWKKGREGGGGEGAYGKKGGRRRGRGLWKKGREAG